MDKFRFAELELGLGKVWLGLDMDRMLMFGIIWFSEKVSNGFYIFGNLFMPLGTSLDGYGMDRWE